MLARPRRDTMRMRTLTLCSLALVLGALSGCGGWNRPFATADIVQTVPHRAETGVQVETSNGSVQILVGDAMPDEVRIDAKMKATGNTQEEADSRLAGSTLLIDRLDDGTLFIQPEWPGGRQNGDGCSITVQLPAASHAKVITSNGSIKLNGIGGNANIRTSNGAITVGNHGGNVVGVTSNGGLAIADVEGLVDISTSNGAIGCERIDGDVKLRTSNGGARVRDITGRLDLTTSNGGVTVSLGPDADAPFTILTSNGSVTVDVPHHLAGMIEGSTSNARVSVHGPVESKDMRKRSFTVYMPTKDGSVSRINSSNGSISLTVREPG